MNNNMQENNLEDVQRALKEALLLAEQANRAKMVFLANMSHDLRTPMNGIIGMTAIANAHLDDQARVKDCLDKIGAASQHLLALINDVLDMSRIESGKLQINEQTFSLATLFSNLVNKTAEDVEKRKLNLTVDVEHVEHEEVIGDAVRLQQVFMNLLSNSTKYTPEGGWVKICLKELTSKSAGHAMFQFTCEDNGLGMPPEILKRVFDPFESYQENDFEYDRGIGLGLSIARNLMRLMHGDLEVESTYRKGTKLIATFQLKEAEKETVINPALKNVPVLLVEDDTEAAESVCRMLDDMGMNSVPVESGAEALTVVKQTVKDGDFFPVCLIPYTLNDINGIELARELRSALGINAKIIMFTTEDWSEFEVEARAAGVDDFLSKPLFRTRLNDKITEVMGVGQKEADQAWLRHFEAMDYSDKRILLVDDNNLNLEIASEILSTTGVKIDMAQDGEEELTMFEHSMEGYYDLIISDVQMPKMDGLQAARAIRMLNRPDALTVPIVALSSNSFSEDVERSRRAGMNDHLSKPIELDKLMQILQRYLGHRRVTQDKIKAKVRPKAMPAYFHESIYLTNGSTILTQDNERVCDEILKRSTAVGLIGLYEQKDYPMYCISGMALSALGYTYEQLMEETGGLFMRLIHEEDRQRLTEEFDDVDTSHLYRMIRRDGTVVTAESWSTDTKILDGSLVRMISIRVVKYGGKSCT